MLEERIGELKKEVTKFGGLVQAMITRSIRALTERSRELTRQVVGPDEVRANELEILLDEMCLNCIAQYGPKAKDLRMVVMILKMSNDLERMGDHAVNISESALFLMDRPEIKPLIDIPRMAGTVTQMVEESITAFIREDAVLAEDICRRDAVVDGLRDQISRELVTLISSGGAWIIEPALHLMRIARELERVADLCTNISEDVIYMVQGRVIKHHMEERK